MIDLETAIEWASSEDLDTHDLGVRILSARYFHEDAAWRTMLAVYREREPARMTPRIGISTTFATH